jgi:hypothetical protein
MAEMPLETNAWRTAKDAQAHFGVSRQRVHQLIEKGALGSCVRVTTPVGAYWLIPYPFQRRSYPVGRPRSSP